MPLGLADVGGVVGRRRVDVRVEVGQHADRAAEHIHGMDVARDLSEQLDQGLGDRPRPPQPGVELAELVAVGQVAVQEQERGLLVRHVARQVLDPVAPVFQAPGPVRPLDVGDRRLAGNHAFQPGMILVPPTHRS